MDEKGIIGEITANTWSPRYSLYLAYARCNVGRIADLKELTVKTKTGLVNAKIADLPFDFAALGLSIKS